jgi:hypothetical protein
METKREMILRAYKWREDMKRKSDDELYKKIFMVFMFILTLNNILYIYNNFDNKKMLKIVKEDTPNNSNGIL